MLPSEALGEPAVWDALLHNGMGITAILRELPRMTRLGMLAPLTSSGNLALVTGRLTDPAALSHGRVHPMAVLIAAKTYASGHSLDGKSSWVPVPQVTDALNDGFYAAFPSAEPTGKRVMITTDTSGSMGWQIAGFPMTAAEAVGAMALVTARTEPQWGLYGFNSDCYPLNISPRMRLDGVLKVMRDSYGGSTDIAAPMLFAARNKMQVDTFQVWTDNETWVGHVHPWQALESYRQKSGIDARLQVIAVAPTEFYVADPDDPRQLDVSGLDSAVPRLLADHGRGDL
jgi:60 kDa SS-A/Ro ribonucleoprotein